MKKFILKQKEKIILLIFLSPIVYASITYFFSNSLQIYDAPGHLNLVWQIKNYLWPLPFGWNSFSLLGFDQGRFYPPLFHYLAANLSFLFGVELATKLILIGALIALPFSLLTFLKILGFEVKQKFFLASTLVLAFFVLPGYLGLTFKALTQIGLLTSFVSLPLLFFYFAFVLKLNKNNWIIPSLLLAAILLTHLVSALVAVIFLFSVIFVSFLNKKLDQGFLLHFAATLGLTAFFLVPFFVNREFLSTSVHVDSLGWPNLLSFAIAFVFSLIFFRTKKFHLLTLSLTSLVLSLLTCADYLNENLSRGLFYQQIYNLHLYRLQTYQYFSLLILLVHFPAELLFSIVGKNKQRLLLVTILPALASLFILIIRPPYFSGNPVFNITNKEEINGRFIEAFSRSSSYPYIYTQQVKLITEKNQQWAYGLFTDSTPNGPYLGSLIRSLTNSSYPNTQTNQIEEKVIAKERTEEVLNLFAIENVLFINPFSQRREEGIDYINAQREKQNIIEIPKQKTLLVKKNWDNQLEDWWTEKGKLETLLVKSEDKKGFKESLNISNDAKVTFKEHNQEFSQFSFNVDSEQEVPVLVKFSYSPNWRAYQQGQELPIHQVSPNLMMVQAKGSVKFQYQLLWYEIFGLVVSLTSLIGLVLLKIKHGKI